MFVSICLVALYEQGLGQAKGVRIVEKEKDAQESKPEEPLLRKIVPSFSGKKSCSISVCSFVLAGG